jgi:hypothetical protein
MLVGAILAAVVISTLGMVGFIWYRAYAVREPTTAIFVVGDKTLDGTVVTISGMNRDPIITTINAGNDYNLAALLEPGIYRVTASHGEQVLLLKEVEVRRFFGPRFDLTEFVQKAIAEGRLAPLQPLAPQPPARTP